MKQFAVNGVAIRNGLPELALVKTGDSTVKVVILTENGQLDPLVAADDNLHLYIKLPGWLNAAALVDCTSILVDATAEQEFLLTDTLTSALTVGVQYVYTIQWYDHSVTSYYAPLNTGVVKVV